MVSLALREILGSKERGVSSEYQDPEERTVQRGQRAALDPLVSLDQSDLLERRVNLVSLDFLDILADKDQRDLWDSQDSLAQTARREPGVLVVKLAQEDKEDQRDPEDSEDQEALLGNQEQRERRGVTVLLVHLERGGCLDLREPMVSPDQRDRRGHQERTGCLDILDREEKLVSKVKWVLQGLLESSDLRAPQVRPAPWVSGAIPDPQDHQESRDFQGPPVRRVRRETLDPRAVLVKMVLQD